jgi:hypothetical protein
MAIIQARPEPHTVKYRRHPANRPVVRRVSARFGVLGHFGYFGIFRGIFRGHTFFCLSGQTQATKVRSLQAFSIAVLSKR